MISYVRETIEELRKASTKYSQYVISLIEATVEELNKLDPRDFSPASRFDFVRNRTLIRLWTKDSWQAGASPQIGSLQRLCDDLLKNLNSYEGEGSYISKREFTFLKDAILRQIIERDYSELKTILFPSGAWKSTVVLSGSILEAILYDSLTRDSGTLVKAKASKKAPKNKSLEDGKWRLVDLIEVSIDIGLLPKNRADTIDQVLRDYRNFVHPKKEVKAEHQCTEAEAFLAVGALDGVCNFIEDLNT